MSHSLNEKIIPVVITIVDTETVAEAFIRQVIAVATENSNLTAQGTTLYFDENTGITFTASSATAVVATAFAFGVNNVNTYTYSNLSEGATRYVHLHASTNETVLYFKITADGGVQQAFIAIFAEADDDVTVFSSAFNGGMYMGNSNTSSATRLSGGGLYSETHPASINKLADVWHGKVFDELSIAQSVPQTTQANYLIAFSNNIYALKYATTPSPSYTGIWFAFPVSDPVTP